MKTLFRTFLLAAMSSSFFSAFSQINETPNTFLTWKKGKTELQKGYVVLKSGKKMEGSISLKGAPGSLETILFEGEGKEIKFPAGAIKAYGTEGKQIAQDTKSDGKPTYGSAGKSLTPDKYYEWHSTGSEGGKTLSQSKPMPGFVVLTDGQRLEGEVSLRRLGDRVRRVVIKTPTGKEKMKIAEVHRYGINVTKEDHDQNQIAKKMNSATKGTVYSISGEVKGTLDLKGPEGYNAFDKIILKDELGEFKEYTTETASGFTIQRKEKVYTYIVKEKFFVREQYNGEVFHFYANAKPTNVNTKATNFAKTVTSVGTTAIAKGIANKDAKDNNYESNMDSVIQVSSTEKLIELQKQLLEMKGYSSYDQAIDKDKNESYVANINALEIAIKGRQASENIGDKYYFEWILENKNTGEKTVLYVDNYKKEIENLLYGCYKYLDLEKKDQNEMRKWKNREKTIKYLDSCYAE